MHFTSHVVCICCCWYSMTCYDVIDNGTLILNVLFFFFFVLFWYEYYQHLNILNIQYTSVLLTFLWLDVSHGNSGLFHAADLQVKVIFFSETGERATPVMRQAAKNYWNYATFACVLWREEEFSIWTTYVDFVSLMHCVSIIIREESHL